jgi:hypothetical protein
LIKIKGDALPLKNFVLSPSQNVLAIDTENHNKHMLKYQNILLLIGPAAYRK